LLESIVGQKIAKRMLLNEIKRALLPQTLLFFGPDGSGKFLTALEISRVVNCYEEGAEDCNCESCLAIRRMNSPNLLILSKSDLRKSFDIWVKYGVDKSSFPYFYRDVVRLILQRKSQIIAKMKSQKKSPEKIDEIINEEIGFLRDSISSYENFSNLKWEDIYNNIKGFLNRAKENVISIDEIREVQRFLQHTSGPYKKKVVIIDGAEYMNEEASNSFLKISEDTPDNSMIIMIAVNKKRLKDTIVSRSRNYRFTGLTVEEVKEVLYRLYKKDIGFSNEDKSNEKYLSVLKKIHESKNNFDVVFNIVQDIIKSGAEIEIIDYLESKYAERIKQSEKLSIEEVYELENKLKTIAEEKKRLKETNVNKELSVTTFLMNLC